MEKLAQFIARFNNSIRNRKESFEIVNSSLSRRVAIFLVQEGFLLYSRKRGETLLDLGIKYTGEGISVVKGVEIISTPGKRVTVTLAQLKGGKLDGEYVISTSRGLCTKGRAIELGIGGVLLVKLYIG